MVKARFSNEVSLILPSFIEGKIILPLAGDHPDAPVNPII